MSAERVDGASTRESGETARRVPRRAGTQRYWVIARDAKDGFGQPDLLTVDLDGTGETLPVFSFEEEAEMFLWLQTTEDGREVRETTPGQLVSILYGPCADVGRVMLDPLPEIGARVQISLLGMDRNDFVKSAMGVRSFDSHISPRTAQCESPRRPLPAPRRRGSDLPCRRRRPYGWRRFWGSLY
jgi:hypothetical protein